MYFNTRGFPYHRGRRTRANNSLRELVAETQLSVDDLVMPYFIRENNDSPIIKTMNGIKRFSEDELIIELEKISNSGIKAVAIFPKVSDEKKSEYAEESYNNDNLACRVLKRINKKFPKLITICDIALDAYTLSGHDGLINSKNEIDNDLTIEVLTKMSLNFARNGCKVIAPSDMMDGRVKIIREKLEDKNHKDVCILSYSSKFCSNFYSPFRDALGSKKNFGNSNKKTYQIDYRNRNEALKESLEDINEGADIVMVKPAGYYLDIIRDLKNHCIIPVAAYQVSGEYSIIKNASDKKIIDYKDTVLESLYCIKRSGADLIFSYFSAEVAEWINK